MPKLNPQQFQFSQMFALLILFAIQRGYNIAIGDVWAHDRHRTDSFHYKKLAGDINLFDTEGNYLTATADHEELGLFWESIGGSWGGRWQDGNHYSLGEAR